MYYNGHRDAEPTAPVAPPWTLHRITRGNYTPTPGRGDLTYPANIMCTISDLILNDKYTRAKLEVNNLAVACPRINERLASHLPAATTNSPDIFILRSALWPISSSQAKATSLEKLLFKSNEACRVQHASSLRYGSSRVARTCTLNVGTYVHTECLRIELTRAFVAATADPGTERTFHGH